METEIEPHSIYFASMDAASELIFEQLTIAVMPWFAKCIHVQLCI